MGFSYVWQPVQSKRTCSWKEGEVWQLTALPLQSEGSWALATWPSGYLFGWVARITLEFGVQTRLGLLRLATRTNFNNTFRSLTARTKIKR